MLMLYNINFMNVEMLTDKTNKVKNSNYQYHLRDLSITCCKFAHVCCFSKNNIYLYNKKYI